MLGRRLLILWLTPPWAFSIWLRFHKPGPPGHDPSLEWLRGMQDVELLPWLLFSWICLCIGFGLRALWRYRAEWPRLHQPLPLEIGLLAYLLCNLGPILWGRALLGQNPLFQQSVFLSWQALCLLPLLPRLEWRPVRGWWIWGLAAYGLGLALTLLYTLLVQPEASSNPAGELLLAANGWLRLGWLTQLCLVGPVLEEAWYRSVLSGPQRVRWLLSALVFALVHGDASGLLPLFGLGLTFGWARWGGGYPAAVLAHVLWNSTTALLLLGA